MAEQTGIGGIDYTQYLNWKKIIAPTGAVYYVVPGTGYVYDPFLSQQKGKPVLWTNPQPTLDEKEKIEQEKQAALDAAKEAASPLNQILPVAGSAAGLVGANYLSGLMEGGTAAAAPIIDGVATGAGAAGSAAASAVPAGISGIGPVASGAEYGAALAGEGGALGSLGAAGPYLGAAGAALGGYGLYNALQEGDETGAALSGAGMGAGLAAAAPLLGFGPVGWAGLGIGALAGGLGGLGLGALMGDKDMWKTEKNRMQELRDKGVFVPDALMNDLDALSQGRSKEDLIALEEAKAQQGMHSNVAFARSRNEKDLTGADIVGYSTFAEQDPEWFNKPLEQRIAYAQQLLDAGLVREHHGTVDVEWSKAPAFAEMTATSPAPAPSVPVQPQPTATVMQPGMQANTMQPTQMAGLRPAAPVAVPVPVAQAIPVPRPVMPQAPENLGRQLASRMNGAR